MRIVALIPKGTEMNINGPIVSGVPKLSSWRALKFVKKKFRLLIFSSSSFGGSTFLFRGVKMIVFLYFFWGGGGLV